MRGSRAKRFNEIAVEFRRTGGSGLDFFQKLPQVPKVHLFRPLSRRSICPHLPNAVLMKLSVSRTDEPYRSPATKKGRCRLHGGASGSGGPPGERNGQYCHGERDQNATGGAGNSAECLKRSPPGRTE